MTDGTIGHSAMPRIGLISTLAVVIVIALLGISLIYLSRQDDHFHLLKRLTVEGDEQLVLFDSQTGRCWELTEDRWIALPKPPGKDD